MRSYEVSSNNHVTHYRCYKKWSQWNTSEAASVQTALNPWWLICSGMNENNNQDEKFSLVRLIGTWWRVTLPIGIDLQIHWSKQIHKRKIEIYMNTMSRDRPIAGRISYLGNHSDSFNNEFDWRLSNKGCQ